MNGQRKVLLRIPGARLEYAAFSAARPSKTQGHIVYHRVNTNPGIWAVPSTWSRSNSPATPSWWTPMARSPRWDVTGRCSTPTPRARVLCAWCRWTAKERSSSVWEKPTRVFAPSQCPDGKSILVEKEETGNSDIWVHDMGRATRTRVTISSEDEVEPAWLGNGDRTSYATLQAGVLGTWVRLTRGAGEAQLLFGKGHLVSSVTESDWLAFVVFNRVTTNDLYYRAIDSTDEPQVLVQTPASETGPRISPDGRFVAYMSSETGRNEVYVVPFPTGEGKWQGSTHGGVWPVWNPSGEEIIYRVRTGSTASMMSVSVTTEPTLRLGQPVELFFAADAPSLFFGSGLSAYDVMPDTGLLVMLEQTDFGPGRSVKLILSEDWNASYLEKVRR